MEVRYVKRIRMDVDLRSIPPLGPLPDGCFWSPWNPALIDDHASIKHACFAALIDSELFPCLATLRGCGELMREIADRRGFVPEATWLVGRGLEYVGCIQGVAEPFGIGMIQNLAVLEHERGQGLGSLLLIKALLGFRRAGLRRAMLEVTADNLRALRVYRQVGFRRCKTYFRTIEGVGSSAHRSGKASVLGP